MWPKIWVIEYKKIIRKKNPLHHKKIMDKLLASP